MEQTPDLLHACRYCGYHEDFGWHGEVTPGDGPGVRMVRCIVPAGATPDLLHACRYCGYHEDFGWHGEVTPGDSPGVRMVRCIVPAGSKQLVSVSGYSMTVIGKGSSPARARSN